MPLNGVIMSKPVHPIERYTTITMLILWTLGYPVAVVGMLEVFSRIKYAPIGSFYTMAACAVLYAVPVLIYSLPKAFKAKNHLQLMISLPICNNLLCLLKRLEALVCVIKRCQNVIASHPRLERGAIQKREHSEVVVSQAALCLVYIRQTMRKCLQLFRSRSRFSGLEAQEGMWFMRLVPTP